MLSYRLRRPRYAPTMRRYMVTEATKEFILHELETYGSDRAAAGKAEKAHQIAAAIAAIERGDDEVFVEHMLYRVVED